MDVDRFLQGEKLEPSPPHIWPTYMKVGVDLSAERSHAH
jgi:hypothetical protein